MNGARPSRRRGRGRGLRRALRWLGAVAVALGLTVGVGHLWGRANTDHSTLARVLAWFEADVDDWQRFPARVVPAGEVVPLASPPPVSPLAALEIEGEPLADWLADRDTTALLVARGETLVHEQYFGGADRTTTHTSFSVAKSFLSTLLGVAADRGELSLDDAVTDHVPELLDTDPRFADITLRHLVTMSSGLRYVERGTPWSDDAVTYYAPDLRATALSARVVEPPGQTFLYNNYNPLLEGLVLERATGQPVAELLAAWVWQPMGAEADGSWSLDSDASGFEKMESGINARPADYLRFGIVFAQEGEIGGRRVVPAAWVEEATRADTATDPAERYQYHWWVQPEHGTFAAIGNHGQFVLVDPVEDLVVVRLGRTYGGLSAPDWVDVLAGLLDGLR